MNWKFWPRHFQKELSRLLMKDKYMIQTPSALALKEGVYSEGKRGDNLLGPMGKGYNQRFMLKWWIRQLINGHVSATFLNDDTIRLVRMMGGSRKAYA